MSDNNTENTAGAGGPPPEKDAAAGKRETFKPLSRRSFMKASALGALLIGGTSTAMLPLRKFKNDIEKEVKERYGVDADVQDPKPIPDVQFAYALNISRCVGCRRCVHACVEENNQSRDPEIQYIRVLEMPEGTLDVEKSNHYYEPDKVPVKGKYYLPVQCQQCENPACVKACPVGATWKDKDGIVVIDYDWCIGCRYCEAACPYWARRFNFSEPKIPKEQINPEMAYLGNRIRKKGVMEKCTFCLGRTRKGLMPKCAEACPAGARQFGNLLDPDSVIRHILREKRVYVLKEDVGTRPKFYYWFDK
ncbi:MAG: 4Fe-4S dicluster domain-containing protein [Planctomycetes bacterium]|nr:4Fe-4S dicluster domain-containing protein [Planctomycetota bacterium]